MFRIFCHIHTYYTVIFRISGNFCSNQSRVIPNLIVNNRIAFLRPLSPEIRGRVTCCMNVRDAQQTYQDVWGERQVMKSKESIWDQSVWWPKTLVKLCWIGQIVITTLQSLFVETFVQALQTIVVKFLRFLRSTGNMGSSFAYMNRWMHVHFFGARFAQRLWGLICPISCLMAKSVSRQVALCWEVPAMIFAMSNLLDLTWMGLTRSPHHLLAEPALRKFKLRLAFNWAGKPRQTSWWRIVPKKLCTSRWKRSGMTWLQLDRKMLKWGQDHNIGSHGWQAQLMCPSAVAMWLDHSCLQWRFFQFNTAQLMVMIALHGCPSLDHPNTHSCLARMLTL